MDLVLVLIRIRNAGKGGCMQHLVSVIYSLGQDTSKDEPVQFWQDATTTTVTTTTATTTATAARAASSRLSLKWPLEGHMEATKSKHNSASVAFAAAASHEKLFGERLNYERQIKFW